MSLGDRSASWFNNKTDSGDKVSDRMSREELKSHPKHIHFWNDLDLASWCLYMIKHSSAACSLFWFTHLKKEQNLSILCSCVGLLCENVYILYSIKCKPVRLNQEWHTTLNSYLTVWLERNAFLVSRKPCLPWVWLFKLCGQRLFRNCVPYDTPNADLLFWPSMQQIHLLFFWSSVQS